MQEPQYLTTREFDGWRSDHDEKIDRIIEFMESIQKRDLSTENRITQLETHREHAIIGIGIFSSIISAVVGGVVALFATR